MEEKCLNCAKTCNPVVVAADFCKHNSCDAYDAETKEECLTQFDDCVCQNGADVKICNGKKKGCMKCAKNCSPTDTPEPTAPPCTDNPEGWTDVDGFNCPWFAEGSNNCAFVGNNHANKDGITAIEACCACGGGSTLDTPEPTAPPCTDEGWLDFYGDTCEWYAVNDHCAKYGDIWAKNGGIAANEACCACGGGSTLDTPEPTAPPCTDNPEGWQDYHEHNCEWYAVNNHCAKFGNDFAKNDGITANDACCACGGGSTS